MIRVYDKAAIMRVLSHPSVWPYIAKGCEVSPEEFNPMQDVCIYLTETGDEMHVLDMDGYIHVNCLPNVRGRKAVETIKAAIEWFFKHTRLSVIKALVRKSDRHVVQLAIRCGMKEITRDEDVHFIMRREL